MDACSLNMNTPYIVDDTVTNNTPQLNYVAVCLSHPERVFSPPPHTHPVRIMAVVMVNYWDDVHNILPQTLKLFLSVWVIEPLLHRNVDGLASWRSGEGGDPDVGIAFCT
jgi:hypothetical protein